MKNNLELKEKIVKFTYSTIFEILFSTGLFFLLLYIFIRLIDNNDSLFPKDYFYGFLIIGLILIIMYLTPLVIILKYLKTKFELNSNYIKAKNYLGLGIFIAIFIVSGISYYTKIENKNLLIYLIPILYAIPLIIMNIGLIGKNK